MNDEEWSNKRIKEKIRKTNTRVDELRGLFTRLRIHQQVIEERLGLKYDQDDQLL